jgi:hypothetical protein
LPAPKGFAKGHKKAGGRKKGTPNKLTADIKEAIVVACTMLGGSITKINPETVDGLVGYMVRLALYQPVTMGMLLRAADITKAAVGFLPGVARNYSVGMSSRASNAWGGTSGPARPKSCGTTGLIGLHDPTRALRAALPRTINAKAEPFRNFRTAKTWDRGRGVRGSRFSARDTPCPKNASQASSQAVAGRFSGDGRSTPQGEVAFSDIVAILATSPRRHADRIILVADLRGFADFHEDARSCRPSARRTLSSATRFMRSGARRRSATLAVAGRRPAKCQRPKWPLASSRPSAPDGAGPAIRPRRKKASYLLEAVRLQGMRLVRCRAGRYPPDFLRPL